MIEDLLFAEHCCFDLCGVTIAPRLIGDFLGGLKGKWFLLCLSGIYDVASDSMAALNGAPLITVKVVNKKFCVPACLTAWHGWQSGEILRLQRYWDLIASAGDSVRTFK